MDIAVLLSRWRRCASLVLVAVLAAALGNGLVASARTAPGPGDADPALYDPVLADQRETIQDETAGRLSRYRVEATFSPATDGRLATIEGALDLLFYNDTGGALSELPFRLYPNSEEYADGALAIAGLSVDGQGILPQLSVADTVATLPLASPIAPETVAELSLTFTTTIPTDPAQSYGMFSLDEQSGSYALAHWLPLLAGYDPVDGWELDPLSKNGDPVFTTTALFDVAITLPEEYVLVTTGSQVDEQAVEGGVRRHVVTGPVRDFVMAADADFETATETVDETVITSYYNPNHAEGGREVLRYGAQSLAIYNELFGPYPYEEMDLVEIDLGNGAGGVEFPQLMFIGGDYYSDTFLTRTIPGFLEFIVVHEVAHQWWYAMVGNNQYVDAFIDEGLTNYVANVYFGRQYGADVGQFQIDLNLTLPYLTLLFGEGDFICDQPTDDFPSQSVYGTIIYSKASLGFGAIHDEIGDDAFFAALKDYAATMRFEVATPDDLRSAFERASGRDLRGLWRHWFEAAEGRQDYTPADLVRVMRELGR